MRFFQLPSRLVLTACAAAVLSACGGGAGSSVSSSVTATPAAVSTPVTTTPAPTVGVSTVSGTVTGFGSVIVDGVRVDDSSVAAGKELDDGSVKQVELKLGQHVEIEHDGQLVAKKVRVGANAEGTVATVDAKAGTLAVDGQTIVINTDPALGPVTVFEGYTSLADVQVKDRVEVHGIVKTDAAGATSLQATRIEKAGATAGADDTVDHVNGLVAGLTATTFKLGDLLVDYSAAKLVPAGAKITNGSIVRIAIPAGTVASSTAVKASLIKVSDHKDKVNAKDSELGGVVSAVDATAKTLTVNGVNVDASAAKFDQAGKSFADLAVKGYVVVKGSFADDGTLKAATIVLRGVEHAKDKSEVELHGSITDFVSASSFTLRDVQVDASGVTPDASCAGVTLANEAQVEIQGTLGATGTVKASVISCEKVENEAKDGAGKGHTVLSRSGTISKVDATAKTFSLTTSKETLSVDWSDATVFRDGDATKLAGTTRVEVQGTSSGGVLHATKIVLTKGK
jgi:uncharacterized protein YdeI (BOF family)